MKTPTLSQAPTMMKSLLQAQAMTLYNQIIQAIAVDIACGGD
jgi:hypothetical protein